MVVVIVIAALPRWPLWTRISTPMPPLCVTKRSIRSCLQTCLGTRYKELLGVVLPDTAKHPHHITRVQSVRMVWVIVNRSSHDNLCTWAARLKTTSK